MSDYFNDQAALLRRLCDQHADPDDTESYRSERRAERWERLLKRADDEEDAERYDGMS